jgi:hypothetical protein
MNLRIVRYLKRGCGGSFENAQRHICLAACYQLSFCIDRMRKSIAIVSASDEKYFWLLRGLVQSIHDRGWAQKADICVIDIGMTERQVQELTPLITTRIEAQWDIDFPGRATLPKWAMAMVARPRLPVHFPGYDIYVWIDADAWMADERAVQLLVEAAREDGLAIVPEVHAAYQWFYAPSDWSPKQTVYRCYLEAWDETIAQRFSTMPPLNAGVFAMRPDQLSWERWAFRMAEGFSRSNHLLVEQCALNLAIYADNVRCSFLPAWCNWLCHQAVPRYNAAYKRFEEPTRPYIPLSIIHISNNRELRFKMVTAVGKQEEVWFNYMELKRIQAIGL